MESTAHSKSARRPRRLLFSAIALAVAGCAVGPARTAMDRRNEGHLDRQEAICLRSDDPAWPWILKWALTEDTWNNGELFLTVHERANLSHEPDGSAAIYEDDGKQLHLLKRMDGNISHFLRPTVVWTPVKGGDREQLIQLTEIFYGTGHFTTEHIFTTVATALGVKLEEVEFIPADESYKEHLAPGEGVWKGVYSRFTEDRLEFEFWIWKDGDGNCCPSAGKVTGTYRLERRPDGRLRISADTFHREPIPKE